MTEPKATQEEHPWRATTRTIFQGLVGLCAMWAILIEAIGVDPNLPWVATSMVIAAGVTRVMALPQVNDFLRKYFRWLASD